MSIHFHTEHAGDELCSCAVSGCGDHGLLSLLQQRRFPGTDQGHPAADRCVDACAHGASIPAPRRIWPGAGCHFGARGSADRNGVGFDRILHFWRAAARGPDHRIPARVFDRQCHRPSERRRDLCHLHPEQLYRACPVSAPERPPLVFPGGQRKSVLLACGRSSPAGSSGGGGLAAQRPDFRFRPAHCGARDSRHGQSPMSSSG